MEVRIVKDLAETALAGRVDSKEVIETKNARLLEVRILKELRVRSPDVQITKGLRWLRQGFDTPTGSGLATRAKVAEDTEKRKVSGKTGFARESEGGE